MSPGAIQTTRAVLEFPCDRCGGKGEAVAGTSDNKSLWIWCKCGESWDAERPAQNTEKEQ